MSTVLLVLAGIAVILLLTTGIVGERGWVVRRSTRASRERGSFAALIRSVHAYVYGRWTNQYVAVLIKQVFPRLKERGKKWWSDRYHGKVLTHELATAIVTVNKKIERRDLDQVIPYPMARDFILNGPPDIAVIECACRHARGRNCSPSKVCMVVGQPFVDFVMDHHKESRRLTQYEALDLLRQEHQSGHVHSAWFKDAFGGRFYAICNCCKCCCGGIEAMTRWGTPMIASSGFVATIDPALCSGCGDCVEACAFRGMSLEDGVAVVHWDHCMGCGVCTGQCAMEAVTLVRDERKGIPLDVRVMTGPVPPPGFSTR